MPVSIDQLQSTEDIPGVAQGLIQRYFALWGEQSSRGRCDCSSFCRERRTRPRCLGRFVISVAHLCCQCLWMVSTVSDGQPREAGWGLAE